MTDPQPHSTVIENPWRSLRQYTTARIALGRTGVSQPTSHQLAFQLAHAQARDAVHSALDSATLVHELEALGYSAITAHSAAPDRRTYLLRPDLGRTLDPASAARIRQLAENRAQAYDIAFVIADGLSATAVHNHALPLLAIVLPALIERGWRIAPITIVEQGRVAIGDEIGALLGARLCAVLLGERPGLSAPDSLGVYLTYDPLVGRTDAERNCISNIRAAGLSYTAAASTLLYLATEAHRLQLSGIALKHDAEAVPLDSAVGQGHSSGDSLSPS